MTDLPALWGASGPSRQVARAARALERTELEVYHHQLATRVAAECDMADAKALGDVARHALSEEVSLLDDGLELAKDSLAARELVARKVSLFSRANDQRISRRFGG